MKRLSSRCDIGRGLTVWALALLPLMTWVAVVAAHGPEVLIKSNPPDGAVLQQSPAQVVTWFTTELETDSTLQVFNLEGQQVDRGEGGIDLYDPDHASMIVSLPSLPDGVYIVRWKAILADGDTVESVFAFGVGESGDAVRQIQADQILIAQETSLADDDSRVPLGALAVSIGILVLVTVGGIIYPRLARNN